jgi:hypothetical protein
LRHYEIRQAFYIAPQFEEMAMWFDEWLMDVKPTSPADTPNKKWQAFAFWCGHWKRLPLDIAIAQAKRPQGD